VMGDESRGESRAAFTENNPPDSWRAIWGGQGFRNRRKVAPKARRYGGGGELTPDVKWGQDGGAPSGGTGPKVRGIEESTTGSHAPQQAGKMGLTGGKKTS